MIPAAHIAALTMGFTRATNPLYQPGGIGGHVQESPYAALAADSSTDARGRCAAGALILPLIVQLCLTLSSTQHPLCVYVSLCMCLVFLTHSLLTHHACSHTYTCRKWSSVLRLVAATVQPEPLSGRVTASQDCSLLGREPPARCHHRLHGCCAGTCTRSRAVSRCADAPRDCCVFGCDTAAQFRPEPLPGRDTSAKCPRWLHGCDTLSAKCPRWLHGCCPTTSSQPESLPGRGTVPRFCNHGWAIPRPSALP